MKKQLLSLCMLGLLLTGCQESMDERCAREAREFTEKKCPVQLTTDVTIDSMVFVPESRTLVYYFTAKGLVDDSTKLKENDLRGMLLKELRNSTTMKDYKEAGYNFCYIYWSTKNKGTRLFEATFHEKDYSK